MAIAPDKERKEFLADISSFANSLGGDILYGVDEVEGPTGVELDNVDATILQLQQVIRDGITPRIVLRIKEFLIEGTVNKYILLFRIERSPYSPHQVTFKGWDNFFSRGEAGKYKLDINQLRNSFISSHENQNRIIEFIIDRQIKISLGNTPIDLPDGPKIIFHAIPINNFVNNDNLDIHNNEFLQAPTSTISNCNGPFAKRINFDGIVSYDNPNLIHHNSYLQIFHNGVIESVDASLIKPVNDDSTENFFALTKIEHDILNSSEFIFNTIDSLKVSYPMLFFLHIIGIAKQKIPNDSYPYSGNKYISLRQNELRFQELLVQKREFSLIIFKPWFDRLWQAFGYSGSKNYVNERKWQGMGTFIER